MLVRGVIVTCLLLAPFFASASTLPAGFAPGSLWLGKTAVVAGEAVRVYTVVYDSSASDISGDVSFLVDGTSVATKNFKLSSGESSIISNDWSAIEGTHAITARIENVTDAKSGSKLSLESEASGNVSITVAAPPPPSAISSALSSAEGGASSAAPIVIQAITSAANTAETLRHAAIDALQNAGSSSENFASGGSDPQKRPGSVLSAKTQALGVAPASQTASAGSFLSNAWSAFLRGLLFICQIPWLFYTALFIIAYVLYKIMRTYFRERRHPSF